MKFHIYNTSRTYRGDIELDDLESLIDLIDEFKSEIIIKRYNNPLNKEILYVIEVYDDYRE